MRVLFLLFCLLTIPAFADESTTCQSTNFTNCTNCETPGKYCLSGDGPAGNQCLPCSEGAYCPGDQKQYCCADISDTNGAFPYSDQVCETIAGTTACTIGAKSKYECYREVSCTKSNGTDTESNCREYYRDGTDNNTTINLNGTNYTYKGNAAHHWVSCPDASNQYDIGEGSNNTLDIAGYHMEASTVDETYTANTKCYANKMSCNQFKWYHTNNTDDATSFSDWISDRYLIWNANNGRWENESTSAICNRTRHYTTSQEFSLDNNYYVCNISDETVSQNGQITTQSLSTYQNQGNQNSVEYTFIKYLNSNNAKNWICESCKAGYMGFLNVSQNEQRCISVAQGYYSDGCHRFPTGQQKECVLENWNYDTFSSRNECNWYSTAGRPDLWNKIKEFCHPCYAGMTTFKFNNPDNPNSGLNLAQTTDGAFSPRQCHYSNDTTQFCDAYGCVSMGQLLQNTGTSQGNWTWYMQQ